MTTPDTLAAAFDPDPDADADTALVGTLTATDVGSVIAFDCVYGPIQGRLHDVVDSDQHGMIHLLVAEDGKPFSTPFTLSVTTPYALIEAAQVQVTDVVDMNDFYGKARELDTVGAQITSLEAQIEALKQRKRTLSDELLGTFAKVGEERIYFGERRAYIFNDPYPEFETKDDGTKYTLRDLVPVLVGLGREHQVTAPTVNYKTLLSVLKELEADGELPDEVAAIVTRKFRPEVRVGVGSRTKK